MIAFSLPAVPKRAVPTAASKAAIQASLSAPSTAPPPAVRASGGSGKTLMQSTDRLNASPQLPRATAGHRRNNSNVGVAPNDIIVRSKDDMSEGGSHEGPPVTEPSPRPRPLLSTEKTVLPLATIFIDEAH